MNTPIIHPAKTDMRKKLLTVLKDLPFANKLTFEEKNQIVDELFIFLEINSQSAETLLGDEEDGLQALPLLWTKEN